MLRIKINGEYYNGSFGATKDGKCLVFKTTADKEQAQKYGDYEKALEDVDWIKKKMHIAAFVTVEKDDWVLPAKEQVKTATEKNIDMGDVYRELRKQFYVPMDSVKFTETHATDAFNYMAKGFLNGLKKPTYTFTQFCEIVDKHAEHPSCLSGLLYDLEQEKDRYTQSHYEFIKEHINNYINEIEYKNKQDEID